MSQQVTPELRQWIIEQSRAGCMPEAVLQAMVKAGWEQRVAEVALDQTLRDHLRELGYGREVAPAPPRAAQAVPTRAR